VPYFLSRYDADPLHFSLTAVAPETRDTEFSWEHFVERKNKQPSRGDDGVCDPACGITSRQRWCLNKHKHGSVPSECNGQVYP
jgi:hypothetical protein